MKDNKFGKECTSKRLISDLIGEAKKSLNSGRLGIARSLIQKALKSDANNPEAITVLAIIEKNSGNTLEAAELYERSLKLDPSNAWTLHGYAGLLMHTSPERAESLSSCACRLEPGNPFYLERRGRIAQILGKLQPALEYTMEALSVAPSLYDARLNLSGILREQGNFEEALAVAHEALGLRPSSFAACHNVATLQRNLGLVEESKIMFMRCHQIDPTSPQPIYELSKYKLTKPEAEQLVKRLETLDQDSASPQEQSKYCFAYSNLMHTLERYEESSKFLDRANKIKIRIFPSNVSTLLEIAKSEELTSKDITIKGPVKNVKHVFLVGMPRSGSTLIEAILSTNKLALACGETTALEAFFKGARRKNLLQSGDPDMYLGYRELLPYNISEDNIVIDKQLYNFFHIGSALALIKDSVVIHCRRNPLDCLLSMYRADFSDPINAYASSLLDAAQLMTHQESLMRHYKTIAPSRIHTVSYDGLASEPQAHIEQMLQFLNWNWHNSYLRAPETNNRAISTASVLQARSPINNSSVGGWMAYEMLFVKAKEILDRSGLFDDYLLGSATVLERTSK